MVHGARRRSWLRNCRHLSRSSGIRDGSAGSLIRSSAPNRPSPRHRSLAVRRQECPDGGRCRSEKGPSYRESHRDRFEVHSRAESWPHTGGSRERGYRFHADSFRRNDFFSAVRLSNEGTDIPGNWVRVRPIESEVGLRTPIPASDSQTVTATLLRHVHPATPTICARGHLRIRRGDSWLAGLVAAVCRLPQTSEAAEARLTVTPEGDFENWERTFDGCHLKTRQRRSADGDVIERFGFLEFRFRLIRSGGGLLYAQRDVSLRIGRLRLRIPTTWAPHVQAREAPAGGQAIYVNVHVVLPYVGLLIAYDGSVHPDDCE